MTRVHEIEAFGEKKSVSAWVNDSRCSVTRRAVLDRLRQGRTPEDAISAPAARLGSRVGGTPVLLEAFGERKSVNAWSMDERCVVSRSMLRKRLEGGMGVEEALMTPPTRKWGKLYPAFGEQRTLPDWAQDPRCLVSLPCLQDRVLTCGWDCEKALATPVGGAVPGRLYSVNGESRTLSDWAQRLGADTSTLRARINRMGWSPEQAMTEPLMEASSKAERDLADFVEGLGLQIVRNDRSILGRQELDIWIPDLRVAVEFNGLHWHSELYREPSYHFSKWKACQKAGIRLIQVWEDDWRDRRSIVKTGLAHKLGKSDLPVVFARKTTVDPCVPREEAAAFFNAYHVQGTTGSSVRYGLRSGGDLVAVIAFARSTDVEWNLVRFATSFTVPGGFSRVLAAFRRDHTGAIKTFADVCISDGGLYEKTGFVEEATLPPDYSYIVDHRRVHKFNYRKARFESDPKLVFQDGLSEAELAKLNGLYRVWDAGKTRYVLT